MQLRKLLELVGDEPLFETERLLAATSDVADVQRQLSRWTAGGQVLQLRRGLYALAPPYQKVKPHPFLVANRLVAGSYVSCRSALAYYGMLSDLLPATTCITDARPGHWVTPLGEFDYRHVKADLLNGYRNVALGRGQSARVASPEKALLDLIYLEPGADSRLFLRSLRLQSLERLDAQALRQYARQVESPKLSRAAGLLIEFVRADTMPYQRL